MNPAVVVRTARQADAPAVSALCGELGYPADNAAIAARLGQSLGGEREVLIAEADGVVVGWLEWSVRRTLESGARAEISGLVVTERRRGQGIGTALVERASASARERGFTSIRVRTSQTRTRTHGFYESLGFVLTKTQRVYDRPLAGP